MTSKQVLPYTEPSDADINIQISQEQRATMISRRSLLLKSILTPFALYIPIASPDEGRETFYAICRTIYMLDDLNLSRLSSFEDNELVTYSALVNTHSVTIHRQVFQSLSSEKKDDLIKIIAKNDVYFQRFFNRLKDEIYSIVYSSPTMYKTLDFTPPQPNGYFRKLNDI